MVKLNKSRDDILSKEVAATAAMEGDKPTTLTCTVVAMDHTNLCYRVCSTCEKTIPDVNTISAPCKYCNFNNISVNPSSATKRLFRVLLSIATDTKVVVVIMFDRAARNLFGCSADDFFDFAKLHPFAAETAGKILEGEMLRVTLAKPKNGNAQHQRVVSVKPLQSGFRPVIETLRVYGVRAGS